MTILRTIHAPKEQTTEENSTQTPSESRNHLFNFIDKLDSHTPIIGPIVELLKKVKNFFEKNFSSVFEKSKQQLTELKTDVETGIKESTGGNKDENNTKKKEDAKKLTTKHLDNPKNIPPGGSYATKKPLTVEGVKLMKDLDFTESKALAEKIFGVGFATNLLTKLDGGTGMMIKRMIALGQHEGGLKFGRQNPDPKSGFNIGTFQIGGSKTSKADSLKKYKQCYEAGVQLAQKHGILAPPFDLANSHAQKDLLAHLGYIQLQRGGDKTFTQMRDPNLSDDQVVTLMHKKIQGGIPAIGHSVVSQIKNNRIDTTELA